MATTGSYTNLINQPTLTTGTGGFSDWYLPAIWELTQCSKSALVVNTILGMTNGFKLDAYYSSTERIASQGGGVFLDDFDFEVVDLTTGKSDIHRVRAVRRF